VRDLTLRAVEAADLDALADLNDAAAPAVNALGRAAFAAHVPGCDLAVIAADDDGPLGFLLALAPGAAYASENYRWFGAHVPGSLYVDRVVVAPHAHGRGVGRALYAAVDARARELGLRVVTCEVNVDPPNPQSLAFHDRLGFEPLGELVTKGGAVTVRLLRRPVASA
jgi:predicted GNAT superfamily acetyltransferase